MTSSNNSLQSLGWRAHFQSQLELDDFQHSTPMRILATHRGEIDLLGESGSSRVLTSFARDWGEVRQPTAGDWLLVDNESGTPTRLLERFSLIKRGAAGLEGRLQLIAANIDTLFITTSCNADFNLARLERYLALALASDVQPVIVLTKADLCDDPRAYREQAQGLMPGLAVQFVDARQSASADCLNDWTGEGQTVALVGSSGVGKSTLVNALCGEHIQATAGIRGGDEKGRHTTTGRSMHPIHNGGWLMDTPGMRELRMTDASDGIDALFDDIIQLASTCKFNDCQHESEPGCAIQAEIQAGRLDPGRLARADKLWREGRQETETIQNRRERMRQFSKMARGAQESARTRKGR